MKKFVSLLLVAVMCFGFVACDKKVEDAKDAAKEVAEDAKDAVKELVEVEMKYVKPAELKEKMDEYMIVDVRKAEDFEKAHIPGALGFDMDKAKEGDIEYGIETMKKAIEGADKPLVIVCYSGARYAQVTTNVLNAIEFNMDNVYTLEGGMKAWEKEFPEDIEK